MTSTNHIAQLSQQLAEKEKQIAALKAENEALMRKPTIAEQLHERHAIEAEIKDIIDLAFEKHESDTERLMDYHIGSDWYDNSIEIYFENVIPYPWEPNPATRQAIYALGFDIVYWNFVGEKGQYSEEIRGWEPRHYKNSDKWCHSDGTFRLSRHGYVDERFNEQAYVNSYRTKPAPGGQTI